MSHEVTQNNAETAVDTLTRNQIYYARHRDEKREKVRERYHNRPDVVAKRLEREKRKALKEAQKEEESRRRQEEKDRILREKNEQRLARLREREESKQAGTECSKKEASE